MRESTSLGRPRHVLDGAVEGLRVGLRGMVEAAQLPHELDGRRPDLLVGGRRLEIEQGSDVSTHGTLPIITTQPRTPLRPPPPSWAPRVRFRGGPLAHHDVVLDPHSAHVEEALGPVEVHPAPVLPAHLRVVEERGMK